MNWLLEHKLKNLSTHADPTPRFRHALEKRLHGELGHPVWWIQGWKWAVSGATILSLAGSATGVYAYTSNDVLPDHPLYGLRQAIEQVEESMAVQPEQKVQVKLKQIQRRLQEEDLMRAQKKPVPETTRKQIESNVNQAMEESNDLPEPALDTENSTEIDTQETKTEQLMKQADQVEEDAHQHEVDIEQSRSVDRPNHDRTDD